MNTHQERVLQSFRRVQGWCAANPQYVTTGGAPNVPAVAAQLDALNGVVLRATAHGAEQNTKSAEAMLIARDEREQRRDLLSHHMATIAQVARALRGTIPGIGVIALPKNTEMTAKLIAAATTMARQAEIYTSVFVEHGLPVDFIKQLEDATAALRGSLDARGEARATRVGATRGIESELALGRRVVDIMDASFTRIFRSQPAKLAEWRQLRRVTRKGVVVHSTALGVETSPSRVQTSPSLIQTSPSLVQTSPAAAQTSPSPVQASQQAGESSRSSDQRAA